KALLQAKEGRIHILGKMNETLAEPREDYKPFAPRIREIIIDKSRIGAVIGSGGKVIQELQEETNTVISIEEEGEEGIDQIESSNKEDIEEAIRRIEDIIVEPTVGEIYDAEVMEILPFGVVVEFKGQNGLLHISEFSHSHIENVEDVFAIGDPVKVKLLSVDSRNGKLKLSRKATMPRPEGQEDRPRGSGDRGGRGGDDRRRSGGGSHRGRSGGGRGQDRGRDNRGHKSRSHRQD